MRITFGRYRVGLALAVVVAAAFLAVACGNNALGSNPVTPTPSPSPAPRPGGSAVVVTVKITSDGVDPKIVQLNVGDQIRFVNEGDEDHQIASNPHPLHTDCPELNSPGLLGPGESGLTGVFSAARTCGYHDHLDDGEDKFQGTVVIGAAAGAAARR